MTTVTYEKTKRGEACREILDSSEALSSFKMLTILPIPTTRDGEHITGCDDLLCDLVRSAGDGELVVGYDIPEDVSRQLSERGCRVCDCGTDERFLSRNAELTAVATLGVIIEHEERDPSELDIGIVGYGRIGRRLTRLLLALGARIRVYTTRREVAMGLWDSGVDATEVRTGDKPLCHDLLINTAPSRILDTGKGFPSKMRIIELAGGDNFPGLSVMRCPSLPARYFPISAGRAWAESVLRLVGGGVCG